MTIETGKNIIDFIYREYENPNSFFFKKDKTKSIILDFIGGEPLLETELIDQILEYFIQKGIELNSPLIDLFKINITTNGYNFKTKKVQDFFEKYRDFLTMTASIDGTRELHDAHRITKEGKPTFDNAKKAFEQIGTDLGIKSTKMTFVPSSFPNIFDSIKFMLEDMDSDYIACNYAYEPKYTQEDAKELYHQLKKTADYLIDTNNDTYITILADQIGFPINYEKNDRNFCGGTGDMLAFAPDGKAYPCLRYCPISIGDELASKVCIGDTNDIYKTKQGQIIRKEFEQIKLSTQSSEECLKCPIATGCGYCSAYNYEVTGSFNKRVTNICPVHKARVAAVCYFHNKRYIELGKGAPKKVNLIEKDALKFLTLEEWQEIKQLEYYALLKSFYSYCQDNPNFDPNELLD